MAYKRKIACYECESRPNVTLLGFGKFTGGRMVLKDEGLIDEFETSHPMFKNGLVRRISDPSDIIAPDISIPAVGVVEDDGAVMDPRSIAELERLPPQEMFRLKKDVLIQIMLRRGREIPPNATKQQLIAALAAESRED
jgi:hypothetical protein